MKNLIAIIALSCFSISYAQDYKKGYLVSNGGERTECLIKKEDWTYHPERIVYKLDDASPEIIEKDELSFAEIGIYDDVTYKRFTVDLERSQNQTRFFSNERLPKWKKETQLLKLLVKGNANLYVLIDESMTKYFFETPTVPIVQLLHYRYIGKRNSMTTQGYENAVYEINQYKIQLQESLSCDAMAEKDFRNLAYKQNALVKLFTKYNGCVDAVRP
jgi:hypothetical protein